MSESGRKGIWFALLLLVCAQGCHHAGVCSIGQPLAAQAVKTRRSQTLGTEALPPSADSPILPVSHEVATEISEEPPASIIDSPAAELPTPDEMVEQGDVPEDVLPTLALDDVVYCVQSTFPLLQAELAERKVADGRNVSAWSPYDLNFEMHSIAAPRGYYKNYRSGVGLKQAVYRGGYVYGGYRIGRDDIQPWYKERLTNEGGEFKVGAGVPLLQGRQIDKYRAEVMASEVARAAVEPAIQAELLQFILASSDAYWTWVAAGRMLDAQSQLLHLATERVQQIEERVRVGDLEKIALIDNQRLIASRETKRIAAERKLQAAAIKLSLFLRNDRGEPLVAKSQQLPPDWPTPEPYDVAQLESDIEQAWAVRPELRYLKLQAEQIEIELVAAENMLQPRIDARVEASKDMGKAADPKNDKTPFELEAGLWAELPLQRRQACGKIQSLQGKLSQLAAKQRYSADKVAAEVRDAGSALEAAGGRIDRAGTTVDLARQSLELGRAGFDSGDLTVVTLNLYERALLDAELQLIEAQADYFKAWAAYQAALGVNGSTNPVRP